MRKTQNGYVMGTENLCRRVFNLTISKLRKTGYEVPEALTDIGSTRKGSDSEVLVISGMTEE